jgi:hypothetical protein
MGRKRLTLKCDRLPVEVRKDILRMAAEGASAHQIQQWLVEEKKLSDIGYYAVLQFLKMRSELGKQLIYENPEFKNRVQEEFSDIIVDYSKLYGEMKELYFDCKKIGNAKGMLLAAEEMRKQVELIKTLLTDTCSSRVDVVQLDDKRGHMRELDRAISKALEGAVNDGVIELRHSEATVTVKPNLENVEDKKNIVIDVIDYEVKKEDGCRDSAGSDCANSPPSE